MVFIQRPGRHADLYLSKTMIMKKKDMQHTLWRETYIADN